MQRKYVIQTAQEVTVHNRTFALDKRNKNKQLNLKSDEDISCFFKALTLKKDRQNTFKRKSQFLFKKSFLSVNFPKNNILSSNNSTKSAISDHDS